MPQPVKKVIRAAAGTGKTYRLSLEYLALLLNYSRFGLHFSEILVITFTKKATAEIRERIFAHLQAVVEGTPQGRQVIENLEKYFGLEIGEKELNLLAEIRRDMLMNKSQVQISTIDSFTNTVFKTVIAPYLGIGDYIVQEEIEEELQEELYRTVLEDAQKLEIFRSFFLRAKRKQIHDYEHFFKSVIEKRWLFHLIQESGFQRPFIESAAEKAERSFAEFQKEFRRLFIELQDYLLQKKPDKAPDYYLQKNTFEALSGLQQQFDLAAVADLAMQSVNSPESCERNLDWLLGKENFWNYSRIFSKNEKEYVQEYEERQQTVRRLLADWLFYSRILEEEKHLFDIIRCILERYDELKRRTAVFTYSDIAYYTFRYLYDPALSLIEGDAVLNSFYEQLSSSVRFVLIDEFQDTSILQHKILLPIIREIISGSGVKEYGGVIVVGDEKQAIYAWRGGERDLLPAMSTILHEPEQVTLDTSFRSDEKVIEFINAVFSDAVFKQKLAEIGIEWPYFTVAPFHKNDLGQVRLFLHGYSNSQDGGGAKSEIDVQRLFLRHMLEPALREGLLTAGSTALLARTNKELDTLAGLLDEMGIRYVRDSSGSLLDHPAVKPLILLLRFLLYRDPYDLFCFLRSDVVLLNPEQLKQLLLAYRDAEEKWDISAVLSPLAGHPAVQKLYELLAETATTDLLTLVLHAVESFNFVGRFSSAGDAQNLFRFLMILADFQQRETRYPNTLAGFMSFCSDEIAGERFRRTTPAAENALTLMTIHKAKGLEFDHVFVYYNLSEKKGRETAELKDYVYYSEDFSSIRSYLLAFNYDKYLPYSSFSEFVQAKQEREIIEELNTLYVAFTRAKHSLTIGMAYQKKNGFAEFMKEKADQPDVILADRLLHFFEEKNSLIRYSDQRQQGEFGKAVWSAAAAAPSSAELLPEAELFAVDRRPFLTLAENPSVEHLRAVFLEQNAATIGNAAHFFLSFVRYGTQEELAAARQKTIAHFGGLIPLDHLQNLIGSLERFVAQRRELFAVRGRVFTEQTLFTPDGREIRIDRMVVDADNRLVEIVDFKTGHILEPEQLDLYAEAVEALPVVRRDGYRISKQFVEIKL
ncbi:MAG: UvrD-helicase domain-containing protein [candidate division KSB1 bacterium]|nr:UvrD-helicase domain-containing protein [candidate division KSB1 bacterium]